MKPFQASALTLCQHLPEKPQGRPLTANPLSGRARPSANIRWPGPLCGECAAVLFEKTATNTPRTGGRLEISKPAVPKPAGRMPQRRGGREGIGLANRENDDQQKVRRGHSDVSQSGESSRKRTTKTRRHEVKTPGRCRCRPASVDSRARPAGCPNELGALCAFVVDFLRLGGQ